MDSGNMKLYRMVKELSLPDLDESQSEMLKNMLWQERRAFSQCPEDIGNVPDLQLHLRTGDEIPIQRHYNAIPKPLYPKVRAHIMGMLDRAGFRNRNPVGRHQSCWLKRSLEDSEYAATLDKSTRRLSKTSTRYRAYRRHWTVYKAVATSPPLIFQELIIKALWPRSPEGKQRSSLRGFFMNG